MNWEEILMDVGIAAIVVGVIGVISGIFKMIYDSKKGTDKLQHEHSELKDGQSVIHNTVGNINTILIEAKTNQRRDFESLSGNQKDIKNHMDKFQDVLKDWERQANIIRELELLKQQLIEKNNNIEKKLDAISEETKYLKKENAELKEKINNNFKHDNSSRSNLKDISNQIQKARDENNYESSKEEQKGRDQER